MHLLVRTFYLSMKPDLCLAIILGSLFVAITSGQSDLDLTLSGFVNDNGYPFELHHVVTEDGYILAMHRIPYGKNVTTSEKNDSKPAVFIMHGLLGCSADWILTGPNRSLAFLLADGGYDVWMGNARGTTNSKNHTHLHVRSSKFWDFSWHEIGVYDTAAMIDYILQYNRQKQLFYIGFSQGTTQFWVLCSLRPEYNKKIKLMSALAPVAYVGRLRGLLRPLSYFATSMKFLYRFTGYFELLSNSFFMRHMTHYACRNTAMTQPVCELVEFMIGGFSYKEFDKIHLSRYLAFSPAGCSYKQLVHYAMGVTNPGHFRPYDYGRRRNMEIYGTVEPPEYPLENVTAPVVLYNGLNDYLSDPKDVDLLSKKLPNVVERYTVTLRELNHFDFLFGLETRNLVYDKVLERMNEYRSKGQDAEE